MEDTYYENRAQRWAQSAWKHLSLTIPVDLKVVSDFLKVEVRKELFFNDLWGLYTRSNTGHSVITINNGFPADQQRFTLAHELGHHLLSKYTKGSFVVEFRNRRESEETNHALEAECDRFAIELLMPLDKVREYAQSLGHPEYQDKTGVLAARFGVSYWAMRKRLKELGLSYKHRRI